MKYTWLVHNKLLIRCRFCIFLSLFVEDRNKYGILVNNIVDSHFSTLYHLNAMADSSTFV